VAAYPVIISNSSPVIVTTANSSLSYQMLIATLNYVAYKVRRLYMEATSNTQVSTNFLYDTFRRDGQQYSLNTNGNIDPYQFLNVLDLTFDNDEGLVLDNMSVLSFVMEPLATLEMYFFNDTVSFGYGLNNGIKTENKLLPVKQQIARNDDFNKIALGSAMALLALMALTYFLNTKKNE
jgi:hypothetical protein